MNFARRWLTRFALSLSPVRQLLSRASEAIREAKAIELYSLNDREIADEINMERARFRARMQEVLMLREAELACVAPARAKDITESWGPAGPDNVKVFKERLWELELALEDRGWIREQSLAALEFSRYGIGQLIRITRIYAIKNPLIKRGAEICKLYVFGRGVEIRSEDDAADLEIQDFLKRNQDELGHVSLAQKEFDTQTDGNQYFGLPTTGAKVELRMIEPLEIIDVVCNPDDSCEDWFYRRQWNRVDFDFSNGVTITPMEAWYPSVEKLMMSEDRPPAINGVKINWDMPILRVKVGCPAKWHWGVPPLYAALDWARAYKDFLEDWATVQRTLSRFALMVETKGGPAAIAAYNALLNTTFADSDGSQAERNPPPLVASAHIAGPDNKIQAFKSAGAQVAPEQARRLLLMVAAAQGLPETFYGDASTGSLATAVSLDRPTELKFKEIQQRWIDTITRIMRYVLWVSVKTPTGKMREASKTDPQEPPIMVKFPSVLEHDIGVMVRAWVDLATLGGKQGIPAGLVDRRTIAMGMLSEVGYENVAALVDKIYGSEEEYKPKADVELQRTQAAPQLNPDNAPKQDPKLTAAVERLREAVVQNGKG